MLQADPESWFGVALSCLSLRTGTGGATRLQLAVGDPFALAPDDTSIRVLHLCTAGFASC